MRKLNNTEAELKKKSVANMKKRVVSFKNKSIFPFHLIGLNFQLRLKVKVTSAWRLA